MIRVEAPLLAPEEALACCLRGERPFLLDGSGDADGLGRYSLAGCDPDDGLTFRRGDAGDPLALLEAAHRRWSVDAARSGAIPADGAPLPLAVGYLSYDLGELLLARRPFTAVDDVGLPLIDFARYPAVWRLDRERRRAEVLALDGAAAERLLARLRRTPAPLAPARVGAPRWELADEAYRARIRAILEYLRAGDAYQVCFAHRLRLDADEAGLPALYGRMRAGAPAPLGAYLATGGAVLLSNTPELLVAVTRDAQGWRAESRPIKGTRRRGLGDDDVRLGAELEASEKDAAEHVMIVDLVRNDLGRVARTGSVTVQGFRRRVELPTVHHLVSTVEARLRDDAGTAAVLRAIFPGGSVTGAPKLRAMEILDALEGVRRGPWCGGLGWLGPGRAMTLALPIRTGVWRAGELLWSVGGGIVADSDPDAELAETHTKAAALLRAL